MIDKFSALRFTNFGQFNLIKSELSFESLSKEYPSNVIYAVVTDKEVLYIGETINSTDDVLKDLVNGNENRATRNRIHSLIREYSGKANVYFLVNDESEHSKQDLIEHFKPVGNINGLK